MVKKRPKDGLWALLGEEAEEESQRRREEKRGRLEEKQETVAVQGAKARECSREEGGVLWQILLMG